MADTVWFGYRRVDPAQKKSLVHEQFDHLAPTYDLADVILSGGLDSFWRRRAIRLMGLRPGNRVLDVCGGTAGLALLSLRGIRHGGYAVVYDFNRSMMKVGRNRADNGPDDDSLFFVQGDAEALSFPEGAFDAVMVGFGLRNLASHERGLAEMHRVLRHGGILMVLEFSLPQNSMLRKLYHLYSFTIMPRVAALICGTAAPFHYLAESIRIFPPAEEIALTMERVGFLNVHYERLCNGLAVAYFGQRALRGKREEKR